MKSADRDEIGNDTRLNKGFAWVCRAAFFAVFITGCATTSREVLVTPQKEDNYIGKFGPDGLEAVEVIRNRLRPNEQTFLCAPLPQCFGRKDLENTYSQMKACVDVLRPCKTQ